MPRSPVIPRGFVRLPTVKHAVRLSRFRGESPHHIDFQKITTYKLYVSSDDVITRITKAGWIQIRQKGSHVHFKHPNHPRIVTVPHPKKDLPIGTLKSIEKASSVKLR